MRTHAARKTPHFYIVNPKSDRRSETRHATREPVEIRSSDSRENGMGVALEIQQRGIQLQSNIHLDTGTRIQLTFPKTPDNTGCFGRIAWVRPSEEGRGFVFGVAVESWHGVIHGPHSWKSLKGLHPKHDRRIKLR